MEAFITGSRAFGKPKKGSDVDLVVRVSEETKAALETLSLQLDGRPAYGKIYFGDLNIIACTTDEEFAAWKLGTAQLIRMRRQSGATISRGPAMEVVNHLRQLAGLNDGGVSGERLTR